MYLLPLGHPWRGHPCAALVSPPLCRLWGHLMRPDSSSGEGVGRHSQGGSGEGWPLRPGEGLGWARTVVGPFPDSSSTRQAESPPGNSQAVD